MTLFELLFVVMVVAVVGGIILFFVTGGLTKMASNQEGAEAEGRAYALKLNPGATVTSACTNLDNDGDGYISCSVKVTPKEGQAETLALECAGNRFKPWASGCKPLVAKVR